jgi:hypothetical protein
MSSKQLIALDHFIADKILSVRFWKVEGQPESPKGAILKIGSGPWNRKIRA